VISRPVEIDQRDSSIAKAIRDVQRAAYAVEAELTGFDGIPPLHESAELIRTLDLIVLGMHERERLVALIGYIRLGDTVDIDRVAVHPDYFRRGFGRRLVETVQRHEADATTFTVSTGRANAPAVALYEQLGYAVAEHVTLPDGIEITRFIRTA
jgi:ribosomal protein S18 acetylase RimI-like enzyme